MTKNAGALCVFVLALFFLQSCLGEVTMLTSQELYDGLQQGQFQVLVDVRSASEWARGHIANATHLDSLNAFGSALQVATPDDIGGCRKCSIAVYCRSGVRAAVAIQILQGAGFTGPLYNGLGDSQWTGAGFPLVTSQSLDPECKVSGDCRPSLSSAPSPPPSPSPSESVHSSAPSLAATTAPVGDTGVHISAGEERQVKLASCFLVCLWVAILPWQ